MLDKPYYDRFYAFYFILVLYSLRLFVTTDTLLKAMARAARMGCSCRSIVGKDSKG
jgi:hypothetical protein